MAHWQGHVSFAVDILRYRRDRPARNNLADENDASGDFVSFSATNVEPQVHLIEIAVKRNRQTADPSPQETKTDQADKQLSVPAIQFRPRRNVLGQNGRLNLVVQHREVAPFGCQENSVSAHGFECNRRAETQLSCISTVSVRSLAASACATPSPARRRTPVAALATRPSSVQQSASRPATPS